MLSRLTRSPRPDPDAKPAPVARRIASPQALLAARRKAAGPPATRTGAVSIATADPRRKRNAEESVTWQVRAAAAWSWRLIVIGAALYLLLLALARVPLLAYSVLVALLLAALLAPGVTRLRQWGLGAGSAAGLVFIAGVAAVVGIFALLVTQLISGLPEITDNASGGLGEIQEWLRNGPLNIGDEQLQRYLEQGQAWLTDNQGSLTTGALGAAGAAGNFVAGVALTLFVAFFFLYDGERIWSWTVRLFPRTAEAPIDEAGHHAWDTLVGYVRGLVLIAFIDALGIGIVLFLVGVPVAIPLTILIFFGSFIPLVGATITGAMAALVALVTNGPVAALIVLGGIVLVQQLEGNVLQPLIMSRFVSVHPLAVALAVTAGALVAGIGGAVVSVPLVAVANTVLVSLNRERGEGAPAGREFGPPDVEASEAAHGSAAASDPDREATPAPTQTTP